MNDVTGDGPPALARNFLAALIESTEDAIVSKSLDGTILTWNKGAESLFGYREDEALGCSILMIIPPELADEERMILAKLRRGERLQHFETIRLHKDGSRRQVSLTVSPIRDETGAVVAVSKIARDITDRKALERQLQEERERLQVTLASIGDGVIVTDMDSRVVFLNPVAESLTGWKRAEALGKPLLDIFRALDLPERNPAENPAIRAIRENRVITMHNHTELVSRDGRTISLDDSAAPVRRPDGRVMGAVLVFRDVSDRRRAVEQLAERARLLDQSRDAILVRDLKDRIVYWNKGAEALYGWTESEVLGRVVQDLLASGYPEPLEQIRARTLSQGFWEGEVMHTTKAGERITVLARWSKNTSTSGEPTGIIQSHTDITDRKRLEADLARAMADVSSHAHRLEDVVADRTADLRQTIAELERFSYSLSHDMRAPLRTIQSFSEIVLTEAEARLKPQEQDLLRKSIASARRLDRLIQDVLTYSRVSRDALHLERIELEPLLDQIIQERPEFQEPRATIEIRQPMGSVLGHEAYLTQCFTNLLDNAVKFVGPGVKPHVLVREEARDGQLRLWFEDNGIGIPEESQARIFEMFQRVHGDSDYPGTGIGLSIVRKAVERMDGTAGVESRPGQGSRFWIQLPKGTNP